MNRIIKFRLWSQNLKMMRYPDLISNNFTTELNLEDGTTDSFMQFTGLTDKNGKEIYEGDILKKPDSEKTRVVKWTDQNGAYFVLSNSATKKVDWDDCLTEERIRIFEYQVIGNIYENPELAPQLK